MDTNVQALKNLYVALGGELTDTYAEIANGIPVSDYVVTPDVINAIAQKVPSGSGSALPAVTTDDNGKLLTVVEGAWSKADATKELPVVTTDDAGKVLKVNAEGAWDKGTDLIE